MALVADGSRICNSSRTALAAINTDFTLENRDPIIYAGGVDLALADRWRISGTHQWFWRRVGGAFAAVTTTGEINNNGATNLVNTTQVTNANKQTTQTATSTVSLREFENVAGTQAPGVELKDEVSGESQTALNVTEALPGQQYEMMLRCVHDGGTTDITFAAKFTVPFFITMTNSPMVGRRYV